MGVGQAHGACCSWQAARGAYCGWGAAGRRGYCAPVRTSSCLGRGARQLFSRARRAAPPSIAFVPASWPAPAPLHPPAPLQDIPV